MNLIEVLAGLAGLVLALTFMYPWALVMLPAPRDPLVVALTTLALSVGTLTLGMFALLWAAPGIFNRAVIQGAALLIFALGAWWLAKATLQRTSGPGVIPRAVAAARRHPVSAAAVTLTVGIGALVLFNAGYWPFGRADALQIYGALARHIYYYDALPTAINKYNTLHDAYPMLVPLSYTYTHMLTGGINEYMARLVPGLLSVGVLGAAYALGRAMYGAVVGAAAALLLAMTPTFTSWASAGYADLPAAFFFTLAAFFAWRHHESGRARDAVLAGGMAGLAAWTKNSALVLAGTLPLWVLYVWLRSKQRGGLSTPTVRSNYGWGVRMLGAMALVAGPWYLRNLALFGFVLPPTGWTWLAVRTPANLFPFLTNPKDYFVPGLLFTAGMAACLWRAAHGRARAALLLIFSGPLFAVWWALFSYETRFLLLILPLVAVMGAQTLVGTLKMIPARLLAQRWAQRVAIVMLIALTLPAASKALLFKSAIIRSPLMGDVAKHRLQTGPAFEVGAYLDTLPAGTVVMSAVPYVAYYTGPEIDVREGWWLRFEASYWVLGPDHMPAPAGVLRAEIGDVRVYEVAESELGRDE